MFLKQDILDYVIVILAYILCVLVLGLWNHVFLFSNLSLFVFLPFAYLFSESTGFPGCRGLKGRVYETFVVLALLGIAMLGHAYVISAWLEGDRSSLDALLSKCVYKFYSIINEFASYLTKLLLF